MSSSDDLDSAESILDRARTGISSSDSFATWVRNTGLGGIILTVVVVVQEAILGAGETFLAPLRALAGGIADLFSATFGNSILILDAGAVTAESALLSGITSSLGPFAFPVAVGVVILSLVVFSEGWQRYIGFSPLSFFRRIR